MSALPQYTGWTVEEYLDYERQADERHEFVAGKVYAMAGASERHNQITSALHFTLYGQLIERPCEVFQSDMRVQAAEAVFFYPDLVMVCGEVQYTDAARDLLLNPTVVIEVLSPSTEDYDRGRKFKRYRGIASLQDYLLVAQSQPQVEHYARQGTDTWRLTDYTRPDDTLQLPSIGCTLRLSDVYRKVRFEDTDGP